MTRFLQEDAGQNREIQAREREREREREIVTCYLDAELVCVCSSTGGWQCRPAVCEAPAVARQRRLFFWPTPKTVSFALGPAADCSSLMLELCAYAAAAAAAAAGSYGRREPRSE